MLRYNYTVVFFKDVVTALSTGGIQMRDADLLRYVQESWVTYKKGAHIINVGALLLGVVDGPRWPPPAGGVGVWGGGAEPSGC